MAEPGMFRSSLHGFHRQDVLSYINEMQTAFQEREELLQQELAKAQEQAAALQNEVDALTDAAQQAEAAHRSLTAHAEELEQLVEAHNRTNRLLREQAGKYTETVKELSRTQTALAKAQQQLEKSAGTAQQIDELRAQVSEAYTRGERLSQRNRTLEQDNNRLHALLQTISHQTDELRESGQEFTASARQCSDECLCELEQMVDALERRLTETRHCIGEQRDKLAQQDTSAGVRLQELIRTIETGRVPNEVSFSSNDAASSQDADDRHFF